MTETSEFDALVRDLRVFCIELIDRIEALTAERDAQHEAWKQAMGEFDKKCKEANMHHARAETAVADNTRLLKILDYIDAIVDKYEGQMHDPC
jgi:hypothetical protein